MFTVKVSQKNGPEQVLNFSEREVRIGRVSSNEIVLPKSNISKRHALLSHSSGGLAITDTKSTNGTFVNGERINGVCDLSCGDKIYLGEFTVEIIEIEEAQTASENPSRVETKSQPKLDPIASGRDAILSDDWGANGEISDSWTGDWKSQTAQAKPDSAAVDALDMASGFPTIEPSIEEQDFAPEVIIPPAPATATIPVASPTPYVDGASTASVVENSQFADLDLDELDPVDQADEIADEIADEVAEIIEVQIPAAANSDITKLLEDPDLRRIDISGRGVVFADHGAGAKQTELTLDAEAREGLIGTFAQQAGLSRKGLNNCVDIALPGGMRVQITLPPLVESPALTIHQAPSHPESLDDLVPSLLSEAAANFIQESICAKRSIAVVSNGYESHPDYTLGALATSIPESMRIVALCPLQSLKLTQPQALCLNAPHGHTSRNALVRHALSMKPSYIVLGDDTSNAESIGYISASGHQPYMGSIYASGVDHASEILDSHDATHTDILVFQDLDADGKPSIHCIYERQGGEYKELFARSAEGTLEASA